MHAFIKRLFDGERPSFEEFIQAFGYSLDLLSQFQRTEQDSEWHAEGNLFIHTQYVLDNVYKLLETEAYHLPLNQKVALILAAVLHDIGKPLVTKTKELDGVLRIVTPHHDERGCSYLAYKLLDLDIPYLILQQVLRLVAYHHRPRRLVLNDAPKHQYFHLARLVNVELLFYLAKADTWGRICKNQQAECNHIDLFRLFCEEYGLWGNENPYADWQAFFQRELVHLSHASQDAVLGYAMQDFENGLIFTPEEAIARRYPYLHSFPQFVMMCGPSGSGKSMWIENHLKGYHIISLDDLREQYDHKRNTQAENSFILSKAKEQLKVHLRNHDKVVWDATNLKRDFRSLISQLGFDYHALVTLIVLHVPESVIDQGNQSRERSVYQEVLHRQLDSLEWVEDSEAHRLAFVNHEKYLDFKGAWSEPFVS
jgi:predicted kinase